MATTKLWHIEGKLKDLVQYVENPEKTVPKTKEQESFFNVFSYVKNQDKTLNGEYVTAINCLKEIALQQMIATKKQYGKDDDYIAWHGYQSFKPGEVSAEECHQIGIELAKEMWGDRFQIIVTTHLDKEHLHNHFAFNSVSYIDGGKYNYSKSEQKRIREVSDRLCREHELSVIERPRKSPCRPVWIEERYTPAQIQSEISKNHLSYGIATGRVNFAPFIPIELQSAYKPKQKLERKSSIYRLYLYYCYQLGYLPKKTEYKPVSPYLEADLRKIDELTVQVDYMSKYKIDTVDDLYSDRDKIESEMTRLTEHRKKLQNKIRRASPADKEIYRSEKAEVTEQITTLRKRLTVNQKIEVRSAKMQDNLDRAFDNEDKAKQQRSKQRDTRFRNNNFER